MGKGWLVGWLAASLIEPEAWRLGVALTPILGHLFPIYLGFRGGKGVATAIGTVGGVAPVLGLGLVLIWLLTAALWRYSSGAALAAFCSLPVLAVLAGKDATFVVFAGLVSCLVLSRHTGNVARLRQGTEPKIGQSTSLHNTTYQT
jgi:glycerol-3-phosphate acyltransferase PlsY